MLVSVEVPDQVVKQFRLDEAPQSRQLLEAFLLRRYAEGVVSADQIGNALGLSLHEIERFLHDHGLPLKVAPEMQTKQGVALNASTEKDQRDSTAWKAELDAWAFNRPAINHFADDSRESIYAGRGE